MAGYDYASSQAALLRQRKLAEMLQAQAFHPVDMPTVPGAKLSPWTIALKGLMGGMAGYQADKADADAKADAAAREEGAAAYYKDKMPVDTPGVPSQPIEQEQVGAPPAPPGGPPPAPPGGPPPAPTPDLAQAFGPGGMQGAGVPPKDNEFTGSGSPLAAKLLGGDTPQPNPLTPAPEGPPMLPQGPLGADAAPPPGAPPLLPQTPQKMDMSFPGMIPKKFTDAIPGKEATGADWITFARGLNKFGPEYADEGKAIMASATKSAMPMSKDAKAELLMKHQDKQAELQRQYAALEQQMKIAGQSDERMRALAKQMDDTKREIAKGQQDIGWAMVDAKRDAAAAAKTAKEGQWSPSGDRVDLNGNLLTHNSTTNKWRDIEGNDYQPGPDTPVLGREDQKEYKKATTAFKTADQSEDFAKRVSSPQMQQEFTQATGLGYAAANKYAGGAGVREVTGHSPEGLKLRGELEKHQAAVVEKLSGKTVTPSEAARNAGWQLKAGDDWQRIQEKMQAAAAQVRADAKRETSDKMLEHAYKASKKNPAADTGAPRAATPNAPRAATPAAAQGKKPTQAEIDALEQAYPERK